MKKKKIEKNEDYLLNESGVILNNLSRSFKSIRSQIKKFLENFTYFINIKINKKYESISSNISLQSTNEYNEYDDNNDFNTLKEEMQKVNSNNSDNDFNTLKDNFYQLDKFINKIENKINEFENKLEI